jgi:hypothetical protein
MRFYGNERLALYKAHDHKDKKGLDGDAILSLLPKETTVVHDHLKVNHNDEYVFGNAECNAHIIRDMQKVLDNLPHEWPKKMISLLVDANEEKRKLMDAGIKRFSAERLSDLFTSYCEIILAGDGENRSEPEGRYFVHEEMNLLARLLAYKNEHLAWAVDFDIPFTNNLSERSLRGIKSKMKASGQFQNITTAGRYADIKSYIETCRRNGENEHIALTRLCAGDPVTLDELLGHPPD